MKDVLNQIIQIDNKAFEKQEQNERELLRIKQTYEDTIGIYKKEKLNEAKSKAESIAEKVDSEIKKEEEKQKDIIGNISHEMDKKYKSFEKNLIKTMIDRLFLAEGQDE